MLTRRSSALWIFTLFILLPVIASFLLALLAAPLSTVHAQSEPGETWAQVNSTVDNSLYGVTWGNGQFVAVGDGGTIITSPDGINWTVRSSGTHKDLEAVCWGNSQFIAVGSDGTIITSTDGISWTQHNWTTFEKFYDVTWSGSQFVAVGSTGTIITSSNGTSWTEQVNWAGWPFRSVTWGGGQFVAVGTGGTIIRSMNGVDWGYPKGNRAFLPTSSDLNEVTWGDNQFVIVGDTGTILTSTDGIEWTTRHHGMTDVQGLFGVIWGGNKFVAVGGNRPMFSHQAVSKIITSSDGIVWIEQNPNTDNPLHAVAWNGSHFVGVGRWGTIVISPPGAPQPPVPTLSAPTLVSPPNGATVAGTGDNNSITFRWNAVEGADRYQVRIRYSTWEEGRWNETDTNNTAINFTGFENKGTHFGWGVRAGNSAGQWSDWSPTWTFTNSAGTSFSDVSTSHPFFTEIDALVNSGIATGFPDGTFRPSANVTRMAMAAFLTRGLELEGPGVGTLSFSDVPPSHPFYVEINALVASGIVTGFPDGTFRPSANVTRMAVAAFLYRGLNLPDPGVTVPTFSDVPASHPFFTEIEALVASGIATGFPDGTFRPSANVTRMATAVFLVRGLELD